VRDVVQVVATAGHVDHGKSTLVRALTGMEPDRWAEERRRGMTIDLGFAWTTLPSGTTIAFVDVPGHERFVTTMLAGVGPVPAVLLVVAADEGWMPQSTEHVEALGALGVRHGLLVVTRSDLMEPDLALEEAREHLAGTALAGIRHVCVSAATGAGLDDLRTELERLASQMPVPDPAADVRLWVDRAFTIRGAGTVVTGTLPAGTLAAHDELELFPVGGEAGRTTVRALQSLGADTERVSGVARVAVNLRALPRDAVGRGDALVTPGRWQRTDLLDIRVVGLRGAAPDTSDLPTQLVLHIGSAAVAARVRPLGRDTARLRLRHPLPLRIGDRAVLRDPGRRRVVAGVLALDVRPPDLRRRGAAARRAAELEKLDGVPSAAAELARRGVVRRTDLLAMGVTSSDLDSLARRAPGADGRLIDPDRAVELAAELSQAVTAHDEADPLSPGLTVEAASRVVGLPTARLVEAVLRHTGDTGTAEPDDTALVLRDGRLTRAGAARLPTRLLDALEVLRADLAAAPFAAPDADRLAELGLGPRELASLSRAGELLRLADGVVLLPGTDSRAVDILAGLPEEFTLSEARQALGTTRRVVLPLLELLAKTGRSTRTAAGNHRLVRA
jgi:selenocysteine-specific elongation factor